MLKIHPQIKIMLAGYFLHWIHHGQMTVKITQIICIDQIIVFC